MQVGERFIEERQCMAQLTKAWKAFIERTPYIFAEPANASVCCDVSSIPLSYREV